MGSHFCVQNPRVLGTIFHQYKYISTPSVTPKDAVIAPASKLAKVLKGNLLKNLGEAPLVELT